MIWLSCKLNQKTHVGITTLKDFYTKYIKNNTDSTNCKKDGMNCSSTLKNKTGYKNFKEFIEENECLMNIGINDMSNLYSAFKSLCNINAKEFVKKCELSKDSNITKDSPYYQLLSTLSNDYNNFKNYCKDNKVNCNDIPSISPIKTKKMVYKVLKIHHQVRR
ncbi:hypothetical protein YYC_04144 [Plasmodium yoelii 17X]|uniref:Yir1 protein n=2 Tax=Plasmodium yoelii TaxID=5861 RepID=Q7RC38_PLAYO|nr:putative yir1 protein [Plasmodium yoelii yoelii]ETB58055.1 hypothetical protein YYC_04144 [Plasmodium yoelii 17X]